MSLDKFASPVGLASPDLDSSLTNLHADGRSDVPAAQNGQSAVPGPGHMLDKHMFALGERSGSFEPKPAPILQTFGGFLSFSVLLFDGARLVGIQALQRAEPVVVRAAVPKPHFGDDCWT